MNDTESFVARWSRLKRKTERSKKVEGNALSGDETQEIASAADAEVTQASAKPGDEDQPSFDPATLPSIESISAGSNIRDFLQSGVPAELTKAALRRAWTTDPAIRDFIGLAENQWDFTDPTAMPGFGPLQAGDDVGRLVAQAMGKLPKVAESAPANMAARATAAGSNTAATQLPGTPGGIESTSIAGPTVKAPENEELAASQHVDRDETEASRNHRRHGGAMPKYFSSA
jgi:Protein of unknown function (DUF3306)